MNRRSFVFSSAASLSVMAASGFWKSAVAAVAPVKHEVRACWLKRAALTSNFRAFADKRVHGLVAKTFPVFSSATQFATGKKIFPLVKQFTTLPGDSAKVDHNRFVSLYGTDANFGPERAFLWVDTHPKHDGTDPLVILAFQAYENLGRSNPSQRRLYILASDPDIYGSPVTLPHNFLLTVSRWVREGRRKYYGAIDTISMMHPTQSLLNPISPNLLGIGSRYMV